MHSKCTYNCPMHGEHNATAAQPRIAIGFFAMKSCTHTTRRETNARRLAPPRGRSFGTQRTKSHGSIFVSTRSGQTAFVTHSVDKSTVARAVGKRNHFDGYDDERCAANPFGDVSGDAALGALRADAVTRRHAPCDDGNHAAGYVITARSLYV
jgi:hypothetical protein